MMHIICILAACINIIIIKQMQIGFQAILQKQDQHLQVNRSSYNSRYSLSHDSVIDLNLSLNEEEEAIDQNLDLKFSQITYAIRMSASTLTPQQKLQSISANLPQDLPSNTIQIDILDDKNDSKINFDKKSSNNQQTIPQIRLSCVPKMVPALSQMITVMIILTSDKQINEIKIYLNGSNQNEEITNFKERYNFKNTYIMICLINISFDEVKNLTIRYKEVLTTFLMFSSKMKKEITLSQTKIYENVGLLFPQLEEEEPNIQLINFCIIVAQEHISRRIKELVTINPDIINQFYYLFHQHFRPHDAGISNVFNKFEPSKMNIYTTQFFLYFFYKNYREDSINKLYEFSILHKLKIYRTCSKVLSTKYYDLFQNGQYFKQFLLYVYFLISITSQEINIELLKSVVKYNILHQNSIQCARILLKIENLPQKLFTVMSNRRVNNKIIHNQEICFQKYLQLRLKALKAMIREEEQDGECDYKAISAWIVQFFTDLIQKINFSAPQYNQNFDKYQQIIRPVLLNKGKLRVTDKDFAEMYAKIKFLIKLHKNTGELFLNMLKKNIFDIIPNLLNYSYETIIHALILKPQVAEQNKILVDFFQNQPITTSQIVFLFKIWLEMKNELYNYLTIEFILLKFMAINRYFLKIDLHEIMFTIANFLDKQIIAEKRRKQMWLFCEKMKNEMQDHENKQDFQQWVHSIFSGQS